MYIHPSSPKEFFWSPDLESKLQCAGSLSTSRQSPVSIIIRHWVRVVNSSFWSLWTSSKSRLENTLFFLFKSYDDHRCPTYSISNFQPNVLPSSQLSPQALPMWQPNKAMSRHCVRCLRNSCKRPNWTIRRRKLWWSLHIFHGISCTKLPLA